jgi:FlaA1/EpsC-like NDP-sugar epimerase
MEHKRAIATIVLDLPRSVKRGIVLTLDVGLCALAVWVGFYLRLGEWIAFADPSWHLDYALAVGILLSIPIFVASGFYRAIFRHSGWVTLKTIVKSSVIYGIIYALIFTFYGVSGVPRTVGFIQPILLLFFVGASRAFATNWLSSSYKKRLNVDAPSRALIYGAGSTGRQLAVALGNNHEIRAVGFIDDNKSLTGSTLNGLAIYPSDQLAQLIRKHKITDVLLAIPSASRQRRNEILRELQQIKVFVRTLPSVVDLAKGKVDVMQMHDLDVDDLLGRQPVSPDLDLLQACITNKVIMVTGAGGSIGSELCRQILLQRPKTLLLIEQSEFALYRVHQDLESILVNLENHQIKIVPLLASVQNQDRMRDIFSLWRPQCIYHAAAYKHVPLVEHNPVEGIRNNVLGTMRTAQLAIEYGASNFVLISTDKAVRPTNIMGASKRLAEMVIQALAEDSKLAPIKFCMVRFGNVLDSSGSVVPRFREQIKLGGPVTVTHPEVTRYFMTITEAAQLVLQAGAMAQGGDVFLLDMGQPVKILDLAYRMIELSGHTLQTDQNPEGDIAVEISGLRPGEKLYEELLIGDNPTPTIHPRIMKSNEEFLKNELFKQKLADLNALLNRADHIGLSGFLQQVISGYKPNKEIVDWIFLEQGTRDH